MAFSQIGLGGIFTLNVNPAVAAMNQATTSLQSLQQKVNGQAPMISQWADKFAQAARKIRGSLAGVKSGMGDIAGGMGKAALAALPLSMGMKMGVDRVVKYEKQMAVVNSLLDTQGRKLYPQLAQKAKWAGIMTTFTAGQAAEAMEFMVRSGASATEVMAGLDGVLAVAAADGIDLATASNALAVVVKSMGLAWGDSAKVADYLAKTSASTNTNVTLLMESFVYGAPTARQLGVAVGDLSAIFGALADSGLKGSLAGTSFTNMMLKMANPSKKASALLKQWGLTFTDNQGKLKPWPVMIDQLTAKIGGIKDVMQRASITQELFGMRGQKAYGALANKGGAALEALMNKINSATGAAADMADTRMDSVSGRWVLFMSSMEGAFIELLEPMLKPMGGAIKGVYTELNNTLLTLQEIKAAGNDNKKFFDIQIKTLTSYGQATWEVALGMADAMEWMKEQWASMTSALSGFFNRLANEQGSTLRSMTAGFLKFALIGAIFVPVAGAVGLLVFALKSALWPVIRGVVLIAWNLYAMFIQLAASCLMAATSVLSLALNLGLQLVVAGLAATQVVAAFAWTMLTQFVTALATGVLWLALFGKTIFTEIIPLMWDYLMIELMFIKQAIAGFIPAIKAKAIALWGSVKALWANVGAMKAGLIGAMKAGAIAVWGFVKSVIVGAIPALIGFVKGMNLLRFVTLQGLLPALIAVGSVLLTWALPVLLVLGLIAVFLANMGSEANSFKSTMIAMWTAIKTVVGGFVEGFMEGAQGIWFAVRRVFQSIYQFIRNVFGFLWDDSKTTTGDMAEMFKKVGKSIADAFTFGFDAIAWFFEKLGDFIFEAQFAFTRMLAAVDEGWQTLKHMVGALSEEEYQKEIRRIDNIRQLVRSQHDERKKQIQDERDALKKLEADEQRATESKKAVEKYIYDRQEPEYKYTVMLPEGFGVDVNVNNQVNLDGKQVATSVTRHQQEIQERKGFKTKRWQMVAGREAGAPAVAGGG